MTYANYNIHIRYIIMFTPVQKYMTIQENENVMHKNEIDPRLIYITVANRQIALGLSFSYTVYVYNLHTLLSSSSIAGIRVSIYRSRRRLTSNRPSLCGVLLLLSSLII